MRFLCLSKAIKRANWVTQCEVEYQVNHCTDDSKKKVTKENQKRHLEDARNETNSAEIMNREGKCFHYHNNVSIFCS